MGQDRIVSFLRSGPKLLLIQPNYKYRAISDNEDERKSVEEAFAKSVLWGFPIKYEKDGKLFVDATDFLLRDAHGVSQTLTRNKQGSYKLDKSRSALYLPMCKNFPKNTELEALLTFTGQAKGSYIRSVVPSSDAISVRMRHSFVALPDDDYIARELDPRCGFFGISYSDYAAPIGDPLVKRFIKPPSFGEKKTRRPISAKQSSQLFITSIVEHQNQFVLRYWKEQLGGIKLLKLRGIKTLFKLKSCQKEPTQWTLDIMLFNGFIGLHVGGLMVLPSAIHAPEKSSKAM